MKNKITSIILVVLLVLFAVYLFSSVVPSLTSADPISAEPVETVNYDDVIPVSGIVLRDEKLISVSDVLLSADYKINDGDRVAIGDVIASYSNRQLSAPDQILIDDLDRKIELLNKSINGTSQYDLKTLDLHTQESIRAYLDSADGGDLSVVAEAADAVWGYFLRRNIKVQNNKTYYTSILSDCEKAKEQILSGYSASMNYVRSDTAGYFSSRFDGYELFTAKDYAQADANTVRSILSASPAARKDGYVGKLQHYSFWHYVCLIPEDVLGVFSVGGTYRVRFNTVNGAQDVNMTVRSISEVSEGEAAVNFEAFYFNADLYALRITSAQIIRRTYSGLRIRTDSLRVSQGITGIADGTSGVYVLSGVRLVFKPVTILFRNDDQGFAIVSAPSGAVAADRMIYETDSVVVGGKEIYDGKIVNIN